jgi:ribonuclease P protein component
MIGRIVRPADFERVLAAPQRSRSAHFAVHHVAGAPERARAARPAVGSAPLVPALSPELSTGQVAEPSQAVDGSRQWLGLVVPKRHAKRAVTRNLIKRQVRAAMVRHASSLPGGLWVVRLRAPFDRAQFTSPGSDALRASALDELTGLFQRAAQAPLPAQASASRRPRRS